LNTVTITNVGMDSYKCGSITYTEINVFETWGLCGGDWSHKPVATLA